MDYLELRVCTEICLCQLQSGTKTLEQSMEATSLLHRIKTCCKGSHGCFFLTCTCKEKLRPKLSLYNLANSPVTVSDGVFRNHLELGEFAKTSTCIPYGQCQATKASTHLQLICTFQFIPTETS